MNEQELALAALVVWATGHRDAVHAAYDLAKRYGIKLNHGNIRAACSQAALEGRAKLEAAERALIESQGRA